MLPLQAASVAVLTVAVIVLVSTGALVWRGWFCTDSDRAFLPRPVAGAAAAAAAGCATDDDCPEDARCVGRQCQTQVHDRVPVTIKTH
jgi:hypothetical protein